MSLQKSHLFHLLLNQPFLDSSLPCSSLLVAQESRHATPMDIRFGKHQDIMSNEGFSNMLYHVLNLRPGATLWAAPVCSTWVYLILCITLVYLVERESLMG